MLQKFSTLLVSGFKKQVNDDHSLQFIEVNPTFPRLTINYSITTHYSYNTVSITQLPNYAITTILPLATSIIVQD